MSVSSSQPSEDRFGKTLFVAISQLMIISYLCLLSRNSELGCTACLLGRGLDGTTDWRAFLPAFAPLWPTLTRSIWGHM